MMRIETPVIQTPPIIPHPHHSFQSPHSAFSSWPPNSLSQRGTPRPMTATPPSMMGQEMVCPSPVNFHTMQPMNPMNTISPHHRSTPNPEIHPTPYPLSHEHFAMSPPRSCPIRESPLTLPHSIPVHNSHLETIPRQSPHSHTLPYTQPPIFNPPKSQAPTHSHISSMNTSCSNNIPHYQNDAVASRLYPQTSTPTHSYSQPLDNQATPQFASTTSTSSQPSLESELEDSDMNRSSIDESTAKLVISGGDELSDLKVSPTSMPYSVVVTSIATSSLENGGESVNFPGSPPNGHSSKFPLVKERRVFDKKVRREIANCNERKRMENINNGFKTLKVLLPQNQNEKTSKAAILQQTAKYIQRLNEDKHRLMEDNEKLKHELSKFMISSQFGPGKSSGFIQPGAGFQPFSSQLSGIHGKPEVEICNKMQEDLKKLQDQLSQERYSKCLLEKRNRDLESRMDFMENVYTQNTDPVLSTRDSHCKHNYDTIVMSLDQLEGDCYPHNRPHTPPGYERQTPYVEIMDRSTTPYIDRNTPVGHFRAIKSPMPHH